MRAMVLRGGGVVSIGLSWRTGAQSASTLADSGGNDSFFGKFSASLKKTIDSSQGTAGRELLSESHADTQTSLKGRVDVLQQVRSLMAEVEGAPLSEEDLTLGLYCYIKEKGSVLEDTAATGAPLAPDAAADVALMQQIRRYLLLADLAYEPSGREIANAVDGFGDGCALLNCVTATGSEEGFGDLPAHFLLINRNPGAEFGVLAADEGASSSSSSSSSSGDFFASLFDSNKKDGSGSTQTAAAAAAAAVQDQLVRRVAQLLDQRKELVIVVRGTAEPVDAFTDLTLTTAPFKGELRDGHAHRGIATVANALVHRYKRVIKAFSDDGYQITLVGHSLGGGTAALAAMQLHRHFPDIRCYSFGCPAVVDPALAEDATDYITSVVCGHDAIPRFSVTNLLRLSETLSAYDYTAVLEADVQDSYQRITEDGFGGLDALQSELARVSAQVDDAVDQTLDRTVETHGERFGALTEQIKSATDRLRSQTQIGAAVNEAIDALQDRVDETASQSLESYIRPLREKKMAQREALAKWQAAQAKAGRGKRAGALQELRTPGTLVWLHRVQQEQEEQKQEGGGDGAAAAGSSDSGGDTWQAVRMANRDGAFLEEIRLTQVLLSDHLMDSGYKAAVQSVLRGQMK